MDAQRLLQTGLLFHMIGIATVVGLTLAGYIITRQFLVQYELDKQKGLAFMKITSKLSMIARIALLLQIISGLMMLAATEGAFVNQLWFKIKMSFVLLVMAAMIFLKIALEKRLSKEVLDDIANGNRTGEIGIIISRITYLQLFLISFFLGIFVLSVFRFV